MNECLVYCESRNEGERDGLKSLENSVTSQVLFTRVSGTSNVPSGVKH